MVRNPRISAYFKLFLEGHATEWINTSKITDKETHIEAIQIYYKLLDNRTETEVNVVPNDDS